MKKILIVEDEIAYVKLLRDQLTVMGYTVVVATDGKVGLAMAKKESPDLILLDIRMPVMDGMAMLRLLRQDQSTKSTKVIMLTNLEANDKIIGNLVKDQPSYFFVKSDIRLEDLTQKIKQLLVE